VRFFSLPSTAPWGYRHLYAAIAPHLDVLIAGEVLAAVLLSISVWLGWLIGRSVVAQEQRELGALIGALAVLWLVSLQSDAMTPLALQRSFALPIMLLFVWGLLTRRYFWLGVAWLLAALIYPVIIVVLGLAGVSVLLRDWIRERRLPPFWIWNLIAGLMALAIVVKSSVVPADLGPRVGGAQALAMPEFGMHGRLRLFFGVPRVDWFRNELMGVGWSPLAVLAILTAGLFATFGARRARLPQAAWIFLAVGLAVWLTARFVLFTLYLPNRHSRWAFAAFGVAALACAGGALMERFAARDAMWSAQTRRIAPAIAGTLACMLVIAFFLPDALRRWHRPVDPDMERAYAFLATLPRDTLIAAHPDVADFIPLRSQRSVLASTETSLPFMLGYYDALKPRLRASLTAAYASSWQELDAALAPYHVGVMVSAPYVWMKESYYRPFDSVVAAARARGQGFVLQHPDPGRVLFRSGEVYVVRVDALSDETPASATEKN